MNPLPLRRCTFLVCASIVFILGAAGAHAQPRYSAGMYTWLTNVGDTVTVQWVTDGEAGDTATLEYSTDSMRTWALVSALPDNGFGDYLWVVPDDTTRAAFFRIAVRGVTMAVSYRFLISREQFVFRLTLEPPIVVTDSTVDVVWFNDVIPGGTYFLDYSTDSVEWHLIAGRVLLKGEMRYAWRVPRDPAPRARVRLRWDGERTPRPVRGMTEAFEILGRAPASIRVAAASVAPTYFFGDTATVTWSTLYPDELGDSVVVEYARTRGASWQHIATRSSATSPDSVRWGVPSEATTSGQIRVRTIDGSVFDTTRATLTIRPRPYLRLVRPNGGERFHEDSLVWVVWNAMSLDGHYSVEYSIDTARTWRTIVAERDAVDGLDSVAWSIPPTQSADVLIRISHDEGTFADTSDGSFAILLIPTSVLADAGASAEASLAPNPTVAGRMTARWTQRHPGAATLRLYASDGSLVRTMDLGDAESGLNVRSIDLGDLSSGWHRFEVVSPGESSGGTVIVR